MLIGLSEYERTQIIQALDLAISEVDKCNYKDELLIFARNGVMKDLERIKEKIGIGLNE